MTNTVFIPILIAIVTVLVGGYITYQFTKRQEREKQQYERSIKTLDVLRTHASSVVEDFESWMAKADSVGANSFNLPRATYSELPLATLSELPPLALQGDKLIEKTLSMRGYYEHENVYLEIETRRVFESFAKEFYERFPPLLQQLKDIMRMLETRYTPDIWRGRDSRERATRSVKQIMGGLLVVPAVFRLWGSGGPNLGEEIKLDAAKYNERFNTARDWDPKAHLDLLSAEAERIVKG